MAQIAEVEVKINLPINQVYSFITTMENMVYFFEKVKSVEKDPKNIDAVGVGAKYNLILQTVLGSKKKILVEITKTMAHENFEYRDSSSPVGALTGYFFSETPEGTTVRMYRKTELSPLANLITLNALAVRDSKKELEKILSNLKLFLEAEPAES